MPIFRHSFSKIGILNSYLTMSFWIVLFYFNIAAFWLSLLLVKILMLIFSVSCRWPIFSFWMFLRSSLCLLYYSVPVKYYNGTYFTYPVCSSYIHGKIAFIILENFRHPLFKYHLPSLSFLYFHMNSGQIYAGPFHFILFLLYSLLFLLYVGNIFRNFPLIYEFSFNLFITR